MTETQTKANRYFTVVEAAKALGVTHQRVRQLIAGGRLTAINAPAGCGYITKVSIESVEARLGRPVVYEETPPPPVIVKPVEVRVRERKEAMRMMTFSLRPTDINRIYDIADATGMSVSEIIRKAVLTGLPSVEAIVTTGN